jgi:hypothetical protein
MVMQLVRGVIAAIFVVIGLIIIVPAVFTSSPSPLASPTPSASPSATVPPSRTPSHTPSHSPTATAVHSASPTTTPTPSSSPTTPLPNPLTATVSAVQCPGRTVVIRVIDHGFQTYDYAVLVNGTISIADRIGPGATRTDSIVVSQGRTTKIVVVSNAVTLQTVTRHAECVLAAPTPPRPRRSHARQPGTLPFTGTNGAQLFAKIATGLAALLTGAIIFWYSRLWPGRKDRMLG